MRPEAPTRKKNETDAEFMKRIRDFEKVLFEERMGYLNENWDFDMQHYQDAEATSDERSAAREIIKNEAAFQADYDDELWSSKKTTHWMYKGNGVFYFNSDMQLGEHESFVVAMNRLRDKVDPVGLSDDVVRLCDAHGNQKVFELNASPRKAAQAPTSLHVSTLAARAKAAQRFYRGKSDPQAERTLLMKKHDVDWFEAIKRWPLSTYGTWE